MKKISLNKTRNVEKIENLPFSEGKIYKLVFKKGSRFYDKEFNSISKEFKFLKEENFYILKLDNTINKNSRRYRWGKICFMCGKDIFYSDLEYFIGAIEENNIWEI